MPGPMRQPRLPVEPLIEWFEQRNDCTSPRGGGTNTISQLARRLGVGPDAIHRHRREGLPIFAADAYAIRLGLHPLELWPDFCDGE